MLQLGRTAMTAEPSAAASSFAAEHVTMPSRKSPARIVFVLSGLGAGGAERVVNIISEEWARAGHDVTVLCFDRIGSTPYYSFHPRVKVRLLGSPPKRTNALAGTVATIRRILSLRRVIRETKPDVVFSFLSRVNVKTLLATIGLQCPVIISERNNPVMQPLGLIWSFWRKTTYPRAFGLVTMTKEALAQFPESLRARSWVIPNPVNIPVSGPEIPPRHESTRKALVAVGRLVPQKGFDLLLQAFARIAPQHPDWDLVIWGEGPERKTLETLRAALQLDDRVKLPGVSRGAGDWIGSGDAFVLSSRFEGWGNVLLEAMAAGYPVVSFDCQWGPGEMIRPEVDGLLVPPGDIEALADSLSRLLGDPELRQRLGLAASLSATRFSTSVILPLWDRVLLEACGGEQHAAEVLDSS